MKETYQQESCGIKNANLASVKTVFAKMKVFMKELKDWRMESKTFCPIHKFLEKAIPIFNMIWLSKETI